MFRFYIPHPFLRFKEKKFKFQKNSYNMLRQKASVELRDSYVVGCLVINVVVLCNRIFLV